MIYIGIDPGAKGGIAVINTEWKETISLHKYSDDTLIGILETLEIENHILSMDTCVYVEQVHSMPKQGVASTFKFGVNYGKILGILRVYEIDVHLVTPSKWKKAMGVTSDKQTSINKAKELFPGINLIPERCRKEHDGIAEALLIAEYGRQQYVESIGKDK